ncbi:hypothetical protein O6H91_20G066400 [Diphasiastrum complanatum]|uniref:Uncharacterized protein n=1 Tax=Diphasiastrum complanatum TaxID=34168 RepID=A0ACC2ARD7_DIPCM|nr:hypothetical protein O6H91_20G066400 [Diphasiastrum complanatum]
MMFKSLLLPSSSRLTSSSCYTRFEASIILPSHLYLTTSINDSSLSSFDSCISSQFSLQLPDLRCSWASARGPWFSHRSAFVGGSCNGKKVTAVRSMSGGSGGQIDDLITSKNDLNAVVVYSKTWCPYCGAVKNLFEELGVKFVAVELDEMVEERDIQEALRKLTGQSTVPSVFIGGKHIGGCDDTMALHRQGKLLPLLASAGAKFSKV